MPQTEGGFRAARGILKNTSGEAPEVTIRRMRDNDVLGMGAMLEDADQNLIPILLTREDVKRVLTCIEVARTAWLRMMRMPEGATPHDAVRDAIADQLREAERQTDGVVMDRWYGYGSEEAYLAAEKEEAMTAGPTRLMPKSPAMLDRAVVDESPTECVRREIYEHTMIRNNASVARSLALKWRDRLAKQPRALVAISEDRQWLVVDQGDVFTVYEAIINGFRVVDDIIEPGQSADAVLAAWLEGRGS